MNSEISKKQFIIITLVVLVITVAVVATILKNKSIDEEINDGVSTDPSISPSIVNEIPSGDVEIIGPSGSIIPSQDNESKINDNNNVEIPINTDNISQALLELQSDIEVLTDKNKKVIFGDMITPSEKEIKSYMNIDTTLLDQYVIRIDQNKFSSKMYMILKPYEKSKTEVIEQVKQYLATYSAAWSELNVEQYQIIKDKTAIERNGYLIYVISSDNDTIMNAIRKVI